MATGWALVALLFNALFAYLKYVLDRDDVKRTAAGVDNVGRNPTDQLRKLKADLQVRKIRRSLILAVPIGLLVGSSTVVFNLYVDFYELFKQQHRLIYDVLLWLSIATFAYSPSWALCTIVDGCIWAPLARWEVDESR